MNKFMKWIKILTYEPKSFILALNKYGIYNWMPDKMFLNFIYKLQFGKNINFNHPKTFNEKLQYLKLYDRKPEYTNLVDKYTVREYVKNLIGEDKLIPLIGVYNNFNEIDFSKLPNQFVLKCTHDSGGTIICTDKNKFNIKKARCKLRKRLKRNFFYFGREWPYKNVKPRIICEKYMVDESGQELKDYKIMCFNGEPKIIQVISERKNSQYYINHFDLNWNRISITRKSHKENPKKLEKPYNLEEMVAISKKLSKNIPFVRVDLYNTQDGIFFGEMTFYPANGFMDFVDEKYDYLLGSWIKLHKTR